MKLVVGLGNPGEKYRNTRHNLGFLVLDAYLSDVYWKLEHQSLVHKRDSTVFCKPMTFMNLSGDSVLRIRNYFGIANEDILVIYDDLYLHEGTFRLGTNKSSGGHNGLKNIIERLGGKDFCTLRIGIGPRENVSDSIANYVLGSLGRSYMEKLESLYPIIFKIIEEFESGSTISQLQNKYNR